VDKYFDIPLDKKVILCYSIELQFINKWAIGALREGIGLQFSIYPRDSLARVLFIYDLWSILVRLSF